MQRTFGQRSGFSLLELLVVLAIIAVLTSVITLSARGSGARELEFAARQGLALVELACERARLVGSPVGFALRDGRLSFGVMNVEPWLPIAAGGSDELRERGLPQGVTAVVFADDQALPDETEDPVAALLPQFACYDSGEMTPFAFEFQRRGEPTLWRLRGEADGKLSLSEMELSER